MSKEDLTYYFQEKQCVTFFSALFLGGCSLIAFINSSLQVKLDGVSRFFNFWFIAGLGFFYLCIDDYFMVHEGMDRAILEALGKDARLVNFDGWILAFFAVIGLFIFYKFSKLLLNMKDFFFMFICAVVMFAAMVLIDQIGSHHDNAWMVVEDAFKLLGVSMFLGSFILALNHYQLRLSLSGGE